MLIYHSPASELSSQLITPMLPSSIFCLSWLLLLYKALCLATRLVWFFFFLPYVIYFLTLPVKVAVGESWDSPFLLALEALFPVTFVNIARKISAWGSYLNYCLFFFLIGLTIPWQLNARQVNFNLLLQSPGQDSKTALGHNLLCSSVFLVNPLFILCSIMFMMSSCWPA